MANIIRRHETAPQTTALPQRGWDPFELMREMLSFDPLRPLGTLGTLGALQRWPGPAQEFIPSFEVRETADRYVFKADLPGVKDEAIDISLDENRLTISGRREMEETTEGDRYYAFERAYGSFTRTFTLPSGIDPDKVSAKLDQGVLLVEVPKAPESQPRKIALKAGGDVGQRQPSPSKPVKA